MKLYYQPSGLAHGLDFLIANDWTPAQAFAVIPRAIFTLMVHGVSHRLLRNIQEFPLTGVFIDSRQHGRGQHVRVVDLQHQVRDVTDAKRIVRDLVTRERFEDGLTDSVGHIQIDWCGQTLVRVEKCVRDE